VDAAPTAPGRASARRERLIAVLVLAALGGAAVLASTQPWVEVAVRGARPVIVQGSAAAPALAPMALVLLALAATLSIAGRAARLVLALVAVLGGAALVVLALPVLTDPAGAASGSVTTATGIAGSASVRAVIARATATGWPVLAALSGALTVVAGLLVAIRSPRWPTGGRRFRPSSARAVTTDPVEEWDALTAGNDPTAASDPGGTDGARP
jgi:uncharacterized membrane protein (TIGR02234 family)